MRRLKVALLGPKGSFSDALASRLKMKKYYTGSFEEIFRCVISKKTAYGLIPVKNTIQGKLSKVEKLMKKFKTRIAVQKTLSLPISLALASSQKLPLNKIKTLYASETIFPQCGKFIKKYLTHAKIKTAKSSSASLEYASRFKKSAGIGSIKGAKFYKLKVLARDIQDKKRNITTFVLFARKA